MSFHKQYTPFGLLFGGVFIIASCWGIWRQDWSFSLLRAAGAGVGLMFLLTGFFLSEFLRIPYRLWMSLGMLLGKISGRLMMLLFFYGPLLIVSLFTRLSSRDPLLLSKPRDGTCWKVRHYDPKWDDPATNYRNQF
jgi:hypothetical protein